MSALRQMLGELFTDEEAEAFTRAILRAMGYAA